jgi:hypothetical protein
LVLRVAEGEIVHRPLARRKRPVAAKQGIGHGPAGLDFAVDTTAAG